MFYFSACLLLLLPLVHSQLLGWINSPDYPLGYPNHISQNWSVCAPEGFSVSLTIIHLDLENSTQCEHDALMIFMDTHLKTSLCKSVSYEELQSKVNPQLLSSPGSCLSIFFRSDDSQPQAHSGFRAFYQTQDFDECTSQNNPCSHLCYNFIGGFRCSCPHGFLLNPNNHTCDAIDCGKPKPLLNGHVNFVKGSNNEYLSVIKYSCNEPFYTSREIHKILPVLVSYMCGADQKWKDNDIIIVPSCSPVCGHHKLSPGAGRILGGQKAPPGSFPWQVFFLPSSSERAGAFVIGEKWIMTAAHNFKSVTIPLSTKTIKAYVGHNVPRERSQFIKLNISSIHIHPLYNNTDDKDYDNDIALMKLNTPITFTEKVRPLCLPPKSAEMIDRLGWVSGFGLKEEHTVSHELRYVRLPIVDQKTCGDSIDNEWKRLGKQGEKILRLTDNMFCAGFGEGGQDACSGDSGSAFVVEQNGVHWAMGIVSWGMDCGKDDTYGVYTKISQYLDWINMTMSEN
ncbi:mannan-binding lectin serine protease 2-like [Salminus brasiliensis]|uniref:mannan-binding lectin serine protease 2-like n=1 Tax=Salminus brasiliensis TaxID=930266 RepID=UPI003B83603E